MTSDALGQQLTAIASARIDQIAREAQSPEETRTQIGVLLRAMEMLERSAVSSRPSAMSHASAAEHQPSPLLRASGFARVKIRYSAAVPHLIHSLPFTHLDNAAIGYRS